MHQVTLIHWLQTVGCIIQEEVKAQVANGKRKAEEVKKQAK